MDLLDGNGMNGMDPSEVVTDGADISSSFDLCATRVFFFRNQCV